MSTKKWSNAFYLLLTVIILSFIIGCGSGSSGTGDSGGNGGNAGASGEKQDLQLWISDWGADYNKIFDDSVAKYFTPNHPNLNVKISHMKIDEKLLPAVASGKVPDLTYISSAMAIPFALNGALQPLDDFMKANNFDPKADFSADVNASYTWDGKLYGVGLAADSLGLFWSKKAFKDAGLDPEKGPTTLEEISAFNTKLIKKDANGKLQRLGIEFTKQYYPYYVVGAATGSKWFDTATNKAMVNDDATVKAYEYMLNEVNKAGIGELTKFIGSWGTGNNDPFYNGSVGMIVDGYWKILDAKQFAPDFDYGVVPLPKSFAGNSWGMGIPAGAKNVDGAHEFLKWLLTDPVAGKFMAEGTNPFNYIPGQASWFQSLEEISKGTPNEKYINVWKDILANSQENTYLSPASNAYDQWLKSALNDVLNKTKTPKEALDEANKQIQSEIDKALAAAKK